MLRQYTLLCSQDSIKPDGSITAQLKSFFGTLTISGLSTGALVPVFKTVQSRADRLASLTLAGCNVGRSFVGLASILKAACNLVTLNMTECAFDSASLAKRIVPTLINTSLRSLTIRNTGVNDAFLMAFSATLPNMQYLCELHLESCSFTSVGVASLFNALIAYRLDRLALIDCSLDAHARDIIDAFMHFHGQNIGELLLHSLNAVAQPPAGAQARSAKTDSYLSKISDTSVRTSPPHSPSFHASENAEDSDNIRWRDDLAAAFSTVLSLETLPDVSNTGIDFTTLRWDYTPTIAGMQSCLRKYLAGTCASEQLIADDDAKYLIGMIGTLDSHIQFYDAFIDAYLREQLQLVKLRDNALCVASVSAQGDQRALQAIAGEISSRGAEIVDMSRELERLEGEFRDIATEGSAFHLEEKVAQLRSQEESLRIQISDLEHDKLEIISSLRVASKTLESLQEASARISHQGSYEFVLRDCKDLYALRSRFRDMLAANVESLLQKAIEKRTALSTIISDTRLASHQ